MSSLPAINLATHLIKHQRERMSLLQGKRILVIDDDEALLNMVEFFLNKAGAAALTALDGPEGLHQFYTHQPHLVILDLMMPQMHGLEVCEQIRQASDTPIIILTAIGQKDSVLRSFDCGADDYITKPFSPDILIAKAEATLRRAGPAPGPSEKLVTYSDNYLTIDLNAHLVMVQGQKVRLTATEFRLLEYLVRNANMLLTFDQILNNVWGGTSRNNPEYVHVYVRYLRQKLEEDPANPLYLISEHGLGYRFEKQDP